MTLCVCGHPEQYHGPAGCYCLSSDSPFAPVCACPNHPEAMPPSWHEILTAEGYSLVQGMKGEGGTFWVAGRPAHHGDWDYDEMFYIGGIHDAVGGATPEEAVLKLHERLKGKSEGDS